jgi:PEP-CTERM motif-containing protein
VIQGGDGNVDVNILPMPFASGQVMTDQFGQFAFASISWSVFLNGVPVFFTDEMLIEVREPNQTGGFQLTPGLLSRTFTLQYGVPNTISVNIIGVAAGANEIPEPATVVLLISGLGFMTGVLKKRRNTAD